MTSICPSYLTGRGGLKDFIAKMTAKEVAELLDISPDHVRRLRQTGKITAEGSGRVYWYDRASVEKYKADKENRHRETVRGQREERKHMQYREILEKALGDGRRRHPDASPAHHSAFANSVAYLVTGMAGGFGGPSIRQHAVSHAAINAGRPGGKGWDYDEALTFADPLVFGPITDLHRSLAEFEYCFDDDPADLAELGKSLKD